MNTFIIEGNIVDIPAGQIFNGSVEVDGNKIKKLNNTYT